MNIFKTAILLTGLTLILVLAGEYFGGEGGALLAFAVAAAMNFFSYFYSDKIALRMYRAQAVTRDQLPRVYAVVERLTGRAGIPMPKIYVLPTESPNAFATGRNPAHASVAFTGGILNLMSDTEIEGVVAHELGHVLHRDILISSVAGMLAAAITMLARMAFFFGGSRDSRDRGGGILGTLFMMILAPIAAMLIQMAISRSREYDADAASAKYVGSPYPLIGGLQKLETWSKRIPMDASPATAHMFIIKPFTGQNMMMRLFSTHPATADRIARLQAMR